MKIGIICYPTYGGSGIVATELGKELAARGHEIHFISSAPPFRLNTISGEHQLSRGRGDHLPALRPPAVHTGAGHQDGGGRRTAPAGPPALPLCDPALGQRVPGQVHARAAEASGRHHPPWNRHHAGGLRPFVSADHQILHREVRRRDRGFELPEGGDLQDHRGEEGNRGDLQLRQLRPLHARDGRQAPPALRPERRARADPPLQFQAGETPDRT